MRHIKRSSYNSNQGYDKISPKKEKGEICMLGGIYSDQKCPLCGGRYTDDGKRGLLCKNHPAQRATSFKVIFIKGLTRRFKTYEEAQQFLFGLRFEYAKGKYDPSEYKKDKSIGFKTLAVQWLDSRKNRIKHKSYKNLENYIKRAIEFWGQIDIREIKYSDIEDFLFEQKKKGSDQPISSKTMANIKSALVSFWTWLRRQGILEYHQIPEFPSINVELGRRKIVDKDTQEEILDEIYRLTYHINPKIWLGIRFLCSYISIRPGELIRIREKDFDLRYGSVLIPHPKERRPKNVPLLEEDIEHVKNIYKLIPEGMPDMHFFRHVPGIKGCKAGQSFGNRYLYKWWKKACKNLGIEGVDMYGGTRHSSATALGQKRSPEEIRKATMHSSNKAFERYFSMDDEAIRDIYRDTRNDKTDKKLTSLSGPSRNSNPLKS